ncbi:rhomboid protease GluP [Mucilaginibacter sp. UYP25]|uniref:rhomboid family intramembrane serine protease n=1 Tax=unclassified Mucilaginibacter TaxID=2617802 RepID=UPI003399CAF3
MNRHILKIRLVFIPYLILGFCIIAGYTFLNWLIIIQFKLLTLPDEVVELWTPIAIVGLLVLIFLYPRIKLLSLKTSRDNLPFFYGFIAVVALTIPTLISQKYIATAVGKLTPLTNIDSIDQKPATKYYTLKKVFVSKKNAKFHVRFETTGKNNEYLDFYIDAVCPIFSAEKLETVSNSTNLSFAIDTLHPKAWLGIEYNKSVSNRLSEQEKQSLYKEFATEIDTKFATDNLDDFVYLERAGNNKKRGSFIKAIGYNTTTIILEAKFEPFESRTGEKLFWIFGSFGIGAAAMFIMIIIPKLDQKNVANYQAPDKKSRISYIDFIKKSLSLTNPGLITMLIIGLNIAVFIAMVLAGFGVVSFDSEDLLRWGANYGPAVENGEWWRVVTCTFLHGGLMHLLGNIYGLFLVSLILESIFNKFQFISIYLICGIGGSLASLLWHPNSVGVGASGAIFGLYGVYFILYILNKSEIRASKAILIGSLIFIGLNLLIGLTGNIDNAAHVGGLITGIIAGFAFSFFIPTKKAKRKYARKKKVLTEEPPA